MGFGIRFPTVLLGFKMGREVRRVALDFEWPINKTWHGFLNPHWGKHVDCVCTQRGFGGASYRASELQDLWYGHRAFRPEDNGSVPFEPTHPYFQEDAIRKTVHSPEFYGTGEAAILYEATRMVQLYNSQWKYHLNQSDIDIIVARYDFAFRDLTHEWVDGKWTEKNPNVELTKDVVQAYLLRDFGSNISWVLIKGICEREGVSALCHECGGEGYHWPSDEDKKAYEEWEGFGPPEGDGWQLWETVSEGSPQSPVFATPEELADWLGGPRSSQKRTINRDVTRDQWMQFIVGPGWAPSSMVINSKVMTGVEGVVSTLEPTDVAAW
jgi:hypothetical protein